MKDAGLNWLHANRLSNRLIGPFGFSPITRSFDAVLLQTGDNTARWVAFAGYPTHGAFDLNGNPTLTNVNQIYLPMPVLRRRRVIATTGVCSGDGIAIAATC